MKNGWKKKLAALTAAVAAAVTLAAAPVSAYSTVCPVEGAWASASFSEEGARWVMQDGRVIVTDAAGNIVSQTPAGTQEVAGIRREPGKGITFVEAASVSDMNAKLRLAADSMSTLVTVQVPHQGELPQYVNGIDLNGMQGVSSLSAAYLYDFLASPQDPGTLLVSISYDDATQIIGYLKQENTGFAVLSPEMELTLQKAREIVNTYTNASMSEYEKVAALYQYVCDNVSYSYDDLTRFSAAEALLEGSSVCDGYARSMKLLCYLAGVDCLKVTGSAGGVSHAWNKVKVDGAWYNLDATWGDTGGGRENYFLISDDMLRATHTWPEDGRYPASPSAYQAAPPAA